MGNGTHGKIGFMVNTVDRDGAPWGMRHISYGVVVHMRNGAHGQWDTWAKGYCG